MITVGSRIRAAIMPFIIVASAAYAALALGYGTDDELLPEDRAFAFSANMLPDSELEVRWQIAEGYYMYRDKISFEVVSDTASKTYPNLPEGKLKHDALFGDVQVYTKALTLHLPVEKGYGRFTLIAKGQGCNEPVGVCYPPITHEIDFDPTALTDSAMSSASGSFADQGLAGIQSINQSLAVINTTVANAMDLQSPSMDMAATEGFTPQLDKPLLDAAGDVQFVVTDSNTSSKSKSASDEELSSVDQLRNLLSAGFDQPEFLDVDSAFKLVIDAAEDDTLSAHFEIADGYYLYQNKVAFSGSGQAAIDSVDLPKGKIKDDPYIGRTTIYDKSFTVPVSLVRQAGDSGDLSLDATYQGCAEDGICYPPVKKNFILSLPALINRAQADESGIQPPGEVEKAQFTSTVKAGISIAGNSTGNSLFRLLLGAFAAGILLTFTPCVLPLIPILSSVIAGQGAKLTRWRGGLLAVFYVIGTAITYAGMGAMAGATGEQLQAYFQNIWAIGILAAIFVVMAFSMFGLFEIQVPSSIQARLQSSSHKFNGSVPLVVILGMVSALIVGACVSPVLISFLGIAMSKADPLLGAQIMSAMALGMGLPLIVVGFGAGYLIPRAGAWMETVKHIFGVMLIGVAIYILGVLPAVPVLLLWGTFLIILSAYLGAARSNEVTTGWHLFGRGLGTILLVWGIAALIGGFFGQRDLLQPLPRDLFISGATTTPTSMDEEHLFTEIASPTELDQALADARSNGKRVMIDFYADWCVDCIKMEKSTFQDRAIVQALKQDFLTLQVDVTDPNDVDRKAVKKQLGVFGPPAVLFFDRSGNPQKELDFYGYRKPTDFLALISR